MEGNGYAKPVLVSTAWLGEHLGDPAVVVAEVDQNPDLYDAGHIPGAIRLHWREDLQDAHERDVIDRSAFEELLGSRGIGNDTLLVLYGDRSNWFAAYAYWSLKLYGHDDVRLLDGGREKWLAEGRLFTRTVPSPRPRRYTAQARDDGLRAYRDQVLTSLGEPGRALVDVRSRAEYAAGHIPTARSIPWAHAVQGDGTFKPAAELRRLYGSSSVTPDKEVTAYCHVGERGAHTWFVLRELLGYPRVRNYDGSWTEWGNLVDVPIER
jgi:thiosulfate/3-mercaptopyruvate sulfurtransferase